MALDGILRTYEGGRVGFWCPACKKVHVIPVSGTVGPQWGFNGNYMDPTFTPSIREAGTEPLTEDEYQRAMAGERIETRPYVCHSQVTDGEIFYYEDSTHEFGGQTLDMEEFDIGDMFRPSEHRSPQDRAADRGEVYQTRAERRAAAKAEQEQNSDLNSNSDDGSENRGIGSVLSKPDPNTRIT